MLELVDFMGNKNNDDELDNAGYNLAHLNMSAPSQNNNNNNAPEYMISLCKQFNTYIYLFNNLD